MGGRNNLGMIAIRLPVKRKRMEIILLIIFLECDSLAQPWGKSRTSALCDFADVVSQGHINIPLENV